MKGHVFLQQYLKHPRKVGALLPSSGYLAEKMVSDPAFGSAKLIVEYGPGTGVFTKKILEYRNSDATVLLIENNLEFYSLLKEKYQNEDNVIIVNGSAEKIDFYIESFGLGKIDFVISGLPFASLPEPVSHAILNNTRRLLGPEGRFITFQYTMLKKAYIEQFFKNIDIKREYRNFPPAYVLSCSNDKLEV
ncbi:MULTISPECIES: class I SAM-dependent methyltransferase [Bacillaceae]|uniref:SAM-dependent methyltransferase n=2 Tax=Bacillus infantis TaxID=324767 RepID=U5LG19_9BACI|nr:MULTISPECIES: methyltransferase domain-containing protein [Bacillus]OXT17963.1 SAM-dependent methyltransferase [Bacillus sp. OG2]AGX06789.1 SAM-dependent methyltransferase [Bacillus infantis NRRL B-14911]EAR67704.1 hypothetical protein B14911_13107 [Bacillus sp. NRRL B-14911]MCA1033212.1 methyltransferase domain-containing protein [Bacillus infantis]MCK6206599.1 methyltransferase domain-containing protein [Bacillus infantis]